MATEISGGGIYWKSGIDNSDFKKGEQEIVSGFQRMEKAAQKSGDVLDKSISSKLGANAVQNIAILERELAKYEKTLERVSGNTNLGGKGFEVLKSQIRALYSEIDRQQAVLSKGGGISSTVIGETEKVVQATTKGANGITKVVSGAWGFLRQAAYLIPGLGIAGIMGAIVAGFVKLFDLIKNGNVALDSHSNAMREVNRLYADNAKLSREITKAGKEYISVINDNSATARAQVDAYTALQTLYKGRLNDLDLETFKLKNSADQQKYLNQQIDNINLDKLRSEYEKAANAADSYQKKLTEIQTGQTSAAKYGSTDSVVRGLEEARQKAELLKAELDRVSEIERVAAMTEAQKVDYFTQQLNVVKQNLTYWESAHGLLLRNNNGTIELGKNLHALTIAPLLNQYNQLLNRINLANQAIGAKTDLQRERQQAQEKLDQLQYGSFGSIAMKNYYSNIIQGIDKKLKFYDPYSDQKDAKSASAAAAKAARLSASQARKAESIAKQEYERQTQLIIADLNNKKKLYEDYEEYKTVLGKEAADNYYKNYIDTSKTYEEYVKSFIKDAAKERADKINEILTEAEKKRFQDARALEVKNEKDRQDKIKKDEKDRQDKIKKDVEDRIKSEEDAYRQILDKANDFYQQKKNLEDEFNLQLKGLENDRSNLTEQEYDRRKKIITDSYSETLKDLEFNNADIFKKLNKDIGRATKQELQSLYNDLDGVIKSGKMRNAAGELVNIPPETLQRLKQARENINQLLKDYTNLQKKVDALASLAPYIQDIADSIGALGDGNTSNILSGVASGISTLTSAMKNFNVEGGTLKFTGDSIDAYTMAAQFVLQAFSGIINAAAQRKAKLQEFYNDMTAMQNSYNLALLEEIRLRGGLRDSVFLKTYSDKVKSGLAAEVETVKQYSKAIKDLQNATVKTGTMKKADWDKIAKNTVSGVAAGAAIGSVVPVIGTAVGAIVGGVVGFVSGLFSKKRVDVYSGLLQTYPDLIAADGKLNKSRAQALLQGGLLNDQSKQAVQNALNLADAYEKAKEQIEGVISELAGQLGNDIMASLVENYKQGGKDAGEAFLEGFKPTLAKISQQLLFEALFADSLKGLQDEIKASFLTSGTDDMARIIADWGQKNKGTAEAYVEGLRTFNDVFSQIGYKDIFGTATSQGSTKSKNSLSGAYAQASQESIDLLSGHTMGMRVAQLETNGHLVQMKDYAFRGLDYAERTANNTANTVARLDTIISKMNNNANNALAAGVG